MADPIKPDQDSEIDDEQVEQLAKQLADRLRNARNRQELTDYAVSLLKESNEDAGQLEQARTSAAAAGGKRDPFNPIVFAIPLFVIGAVLAATGILLGPGIGVMGVALLMFVYGLGASIFSRGGRPSPPNRP